jgi:hypothetical protein
MTTPRILVTGTNADLARRRLGYWRFDSRSLNGASPHFLPLGSPRFVLPPPPHRVSVFILYEQCVKPVEKG